MKRSNPIHRSLVGTLLGLLLLVLWRGLITVPPAAAQNPVAQAGTPASTGLQYYPLPSPVRLLDTRPGETACFNPGAPLGDNAVRLQPATGACTSIPAQAKAVVGNATVVNFISTGFHWITLSPSDAAQPTASNLNFSDNQIVPNQFTVGLGPDGAFKIYSRAATHFVVDITGYYAPPGTGGLYYHPLPAPVRLFETRPGEAGCDTPGAPLADNGTRTVTAHGVCQGATIPPSARSLVGNATVVNFISTGSHWIGLYPFGRPQPTASNLNYTANQIVPNAFVVGLNSDGKFNIYSHGATDFIVDVTGYFSDQAVDVNGQGLLYHALPAPVRLLETRPGESGCDAPGVPLGNDAVRTALAHVTCNGITVPPAAKAIVGNATVVNFISTGFHWITLYPFGAPRPTASNLNFTAHHIVPNAFAVGLSSDGKFNIYSRAATHFIVDLTGYFAPPSANQPPLADAGPDQTIALPALANLNGSVTDDGLPAGGALTATWSKVSGPGAVTFGHPNQAATTAGFSQAGVYVLRLTANDGELSSSDEVTITATSSLMVNAGPDQVVTLPNTALLAGTVTGGSNATRAEWSRLSGPGPALFGNASGLATTAIFPTNGVYVLRLTATDSATTASDDVQVTVNADPTPLPPDPVAVAPPIDPTVTTTLGAATEFLYTGANPIQTGVAPGTIRPARAAVLRGRVLTRDGAPLPGAKITILNHSELGQTLTRADGAFDLAVNGDDLLTVKYEKPGFLEVQRRQPVAWQEYRVLPDVVMIGHDSQVSHIDLNANLPMQVARANPVSDGSGARRATLLFAQGTTATMVFPNGSMQGLSNLHVRATEYTVGQNGPQAMPGVLPPTSAYTYAVEFNADEAVVAGARHVLFSQPVISYMENFLNFPAGAIVPAGSYDRVESSWIPEDNGRVVRLLSITGGVANLDVTGSGQPATDAEYAALGISLAERQQLTALYQAGQTLWRTPIPHFTEPWDFNFAGSPNPGAGAPPGGPDKPKQPDDPCKRGGSIIECQNQVLRERLSLTGTPFTLNYRSNRVPAAGKSIEISASGATVPPGLKRIEVEIFIAGRRFLQTFPAAPNQGFTFTWDGRDVYSRAVQGSQTATVRIGYVYDGFYQLPEGTARAFARYPRLPLTQAHSARHELAIFQQYNEELFNQDTRASDLGAWTLSVHHAYDPLGQTLHLGDGARRSAASLPQTITSVAGGGGSESCPATQPCGDGGQAIGATVDAQSIAVDGQGNIYLADTFRNKIRKVDAAGIITTVAGTGVGGFSGDGGPATQARLNFPYGVAVDAQGNLFIADQSNHRVRKVNTAGIITTIAGDGTRSFSGDDGPATQARLNLPRAVAVAPDGRLFIADFGNSRIRGVSPDGIITTVAVDNGLQGISEPTDVKLDGEGNLFIASSRNRLVLRLNPDGRLMVAAGGGNNGADGIPATGAFFQPTGIAVDRRGNLFITDFFARRVRKVDSRGIITTVAGGGASLSENIRDGLPATGAAVVPQYVAVDERGNLLISDRLTSSGLPNINRVRKVGSPLPQFDGESFTIVSEDGGRLYNFDHTGRHLRTLNALTGATVYTFGYDSAGRLVTVTDGDNNVTTIERNAGGQPTAIVAPFGQRTTLTLDGNGYLASVTNPAGEAYRMTYSAEGLLRTFTDPRNNVSTIDYDAQGRLRRDEDAAGGFSTLSRTETATSFSVSLTTALNRVTGYQVERLANGEERRVNSFPGGLQNQQTIRASGGSAVAYAEGTTITSVAGVDPRWGVQAPFDASVTTTTPGGLSLTSTQSRAAVLSNPGNPLSLVTLTETLGLNGRNTTSVYTAASRSFVMTTPQGRQTTTTIDLQGRLTGRQFGNLDPASYLYDARGRLASATFGAGSQARLFTFGYNSSGYLETITDPLGRIRRFSYDAARRVRQETLPGNRVVNYDYDANGTLVSVAPPGRPAHRFTHSAVNLTAAYTPPDVGAGATQSSYSYNLERQLTRITRPDNLALDFAHDDAGRLRTLTVPGGQYVYAYNQTTGNLASITAPGGGSLSYGYDGSLLTSTTWAGTITGSVSRTYDNRFRIASQRVNGGNPISFSYDHDGLLASAGGLTLTRHAQSGLITGATLGNLTEAQSYNGFAEPESYGVTHNGAALYSLQYTYDRLGRITRKVETVSGVAVTYDYGYDEAGRLREVQRNGVVSATYTYDDNNNRLSYTGAGGAVTGAYDNQDRLTQYGAATYQYTANGELLSQSAGNQTTAYQYDVLGNLRAVTLPGNTQIEYLIDGKNRRIGKRVNGALVQGFLYQDQLNPIAELDGNNNVVSRFVYATQQNVPNYLIRGGVTYRIVTDHLSSPRLVVNAATGEIVQRMEYDEFGVVTLDTNPGFQPFGFAGGLYDAQTKLTRFGVRDYDAETGRWTAKDPILFAGGDTNLYAYSLNDPVNLKDAGGMLVGPPPALLAKGAAAAGKAAVGAAGAKAALIAGGAVAGAFGAGYAAGTLINHFIQDDVQDLLDSIFGDPSAPATSPVPDGFDEDETHPDPGTPVPFPQNPKEPEPAPEDKKEDEGDKKKDPEPCKTPKPPKCPPGLPMWFGYTRPPAKIRHCYERIGGMWVRKK